MLLVAGLAAVPVTELLSFPRSTLGAETTLLLATGSPAPRRNGGRRRYCTEQGQGYKLLDRGKPAYPFPAPDWLWDPTGRQALSHVEVRMAAGGGAGVKKPVNLA